MSRPSDPNAKIDLLRAAEAIFIEHGLTDARVEDITDRAGRSKGSFYLHFDSKEDAFRQIVESLLARLSACVDEPFPDTGEDQDLEGVLEQLLDHDLEVFEFLWQNRRVARLLLSGGGSAAFGYLIDEFAERARARVKEALDWGEEGGVYREELDREVVSLYIAGAYDRIARHLVKSDKKPDLRTWLRAIQGIVLRGIGSAAALALADPAVKKGARRTARREPLTRRNV